MTTTDAQISFLTPTGPYAIGTTSLYFADPSRDEFFTENPDDYREITARIWYPSETVADAETAPYIDETLSRTFASNLGMSADEFADLTQSITTNSVVDAPLATTKSNYPVLFFSHGGTDMPEFNTVRAEELASQGYIVVSINHTYDSAVNILPDGRVASHTDIFAGAESDAEFLELQVQNVDARVRDIQLVLDRLGEFNTGDDPTGLFEGRIDLDRVGVLGASTGGATSAELLARDPRFMAGINLDGTLRGDTSEASVSQPYLQFKNVAFGTEISSDSLTRSLEGQEGELFFNNLQNEGYEVTILGSTHLHYTSDVPFLFPLMQDLGIDVGGLAGSFAYFFDPQSAVDAYEHENFELIDPNRITQITNDYITAFFDQSLNGQESPLLADSSFPLPEVYPEVIAQSYRGDDTLPDRAGDDVLYGGRANDLIYGGAGDDILYGRAGNDALHAGGGNNSLFGGKGNDYLFGNSGSDHLHGGRGDDRLHGGGGDDILRGGRGADTMMGGSGADTLHGGKGNDILSGEAGDDSLKDNQGNNILYGDAGNDWLQTGSGHDVLSGDSGDDILIAGSGNDGLNGGTGDDLLQGGAGRDRFYLSDGHDVIQDFQDGHDRLCLPIIGETALSFSNLEIIQMGQHTEIRWASQTNNNIAAPMNVTVLQGIQASQITEADFMLAG